MPENQRCHRSPESSLRPHHDYVVSSRTLSTSYALPDVQSRLSRSHVLQRCASATTNTARPSAIPRYVGTQNSTGSPSPILRPFIRHFASNSSLAQKTTAPPSVGQYFVDPTRHPNRSDSTQFQQSPPENTGMFYKARDCTVTGTFVDASNVTYQNASSKPFMEKLLEETLRGAEHDSSDRDPPPRCQPGTRLAVLERCLLFISSCDGVQKIRWVVGAAGVGKTAIMQSVAESPDPPGGPPVSVFFSINGRNDGTKAIITLSYQLAAKSDTYRQIIEREITRDPSLLRSSMAKQFNKLIVEPFIHNSELNSAGRALVIIDGLDECKDPRTQVELLRLISDLCLMHPSSPLVWLIASRPEPHITSFFSRHNVIPAYVKEEVPIDSNEACADVERFLRAELTMIKDGSDLLDSRWPEEQDFWKVANAAGGLFAYAQTVINYIGDWRIGSPASQLSDVLHVIDKHGMTGLSREEHPMALLDALYERILSNVPDKIMINTRKLLLALALSKNSTLYCGSVDMSFVVLSNWAGLTADEAYAAVNHLRSVLRVPRRDNAHHEELKYFHKSFIDYISDFTRSRFSPRFFDEARQFQAECTFRILTAVPNGIQSESSYNDFDCGTLANGPVTRDEIPLTWLIEQSGGKEDIHTRLTVYRLAIDEALNGIRHGDPNFQNEFCIRFLTTVWSHYNSIFPYYELLDAAFDETRRREFMMHGILKQIPVKTVSVYAMNWRCDIKLQFQRPITTVKGISDPWNSSCWHPRWEAGQAGGWVTTLAWCAFCHKRLEDQLQQWKADSLDDTALVMFTSTRECCVQVRFVYPDDGMAEWTYSFWCIMPQDIREKYGTLV